MTDRLYQPELKLAFLKNFDGEESTKSIMLYDFYKSAKIERQYNKDLYAFFDDEIDDLLLSIGSDNISSINRIVSVYKDYINWCIREGQRGKYENGENRMEIFQATKNMSKYISNKRVKNKFLTKEELDDLINYLVNPMDQAFVLAIYEFIAGEQLYELRSLRMEDVDVENKKVKITDIDGNTRVQNISSKLVQLLQEANETKTYISKNGETDLNDSRNTRKLSESGYIIRSLARKSNENEMMPYGSLSQKMVRIKKYTGYDFITANSLQDTRVIHEIMDVTNALGLSNPSNKAYKIAINNIYEQYKVQLSETQIFHIKQKCEQAIALKNFNNN